MGLFSKTFYIINLVFVKKKCEGSNHTAYHGSNHEELYYRAKFKCAFNNGTVISVLESRMKLLRFLQAWCTNGPCRDLSRDASTTHIVTQSDPLGD